MLLERDHELQTLADELDELGLSGGKVVLVRGEAGMGKSALVRAFAASHAQTAHILMGSCDDLLTPQPLGPFWDMARSEPSLLEPLRAGDRPAVLDTVLDLLSSSLRPTVIIIEDTHWADEATLDAIKYVGRRIGSTNGMLLLTYRDGEVDYDHPLRGVVGELPPPSVVRMQLHGLSLDAVASIVGDSGLDALEVVAATDGNPFLVSEWVSTGADRVPPSVQDSVMARVAKLSPLAQDALKVLAVMPEDVQLANVAALTGAQEDMVAECERRGLLAVDGEFVVFRHELIRQAVESALGSSERIQLNQQVLDALGSAADPAVLVHHAREANDVGRLIEFAPRAAAAASALGSHREAVAHYRQLTPYLDTLGPESRAPILEAWSREEFLTDHLEEALHLNQLVVGTYRDLKDTRGESRNLAEAAHLQENLGRRDLAEQLSEQAIDVLGPDPERSDLIVAVDMQSYLSWMSGDWPRAMDLIERALQLADGVDERVFIRALNHRGVAKAITDYPDGIDDLVEANERAAAADEWYEEVRALTNSGWMAAEARDLGFALESVRKAGTLAERYEIAIVGVYAAALEARILDWQGHWEEAENVARDQLYSSALPLMVALPVIGSIEARTGREAARSTLDRAWDVSSMASEYQRLGPSAVAAAEYAWLTGEQLVDDDSLRRVIDSGIKRGFQWSPGALAVWLWKRKVIERAPEGIAEPFRLLIEGDAAAAAARWEKIGCPYDQAIALSHGGHEDQLAAHALLEDLGASAVAAKLRQELRQEGVAVPRTGPRRVESPASGLTARQSEVLHLLDEDLSNIEIADRLFVSPRTVEHHVSAILGKLDVQTRDEAVVQARAAGLLPA